MAQPEKNELPEAIGYFIGGFIAVFLIAVLFCFVTQWAWNNFMPHVFNLPEITIYQAFSLNVLQGLLTFRPRK